MEDEEQISSMLGSMNLGDGNDSDSSSSTEPCSSISGSGSGSGSASGSGSDDSTDSVHTECTAACLMIQWKARDAFIAGRRAATTNPNINPSPNTTVYNNPLSILLNNFNSGWNNGVQTAGPLSTVEFSDVVGCIWNAAYNAASMFESFNDNSPKNLPTSEAETLFHAWGLAGYNAGRYMMEQYHYEKHLELVDFTDFFTNRRF